MFDQIPEKVLAGIVATLEALGFSEGHTIFNKGEEGDTMYIILKGSVRVHDQDTTITVLTRNQIFGEFALLSLTPRTASITTLEPTRLYRLHQDVLYQLLMENVEAAKGLIHSLCEKLRIKQFSQNGF